MEAEAEAEVQVKAELEMRLTQQFLESMSPTTKSAHCTSTEIIFIPECPVRKAHGKQPHPARNVRHSHRDLSKARLRHMSSRPVWGLLVRG